MTTVVSYKPSQHPTTRRAGGGWTRALPHRHAQVGRRGVIKPWWRRASVLPRVVGRNFGVYNGHKFRPVLVTEDMIGHKFGEFSPTRTFHGHSADKRAKRA